MLSIVRRVALVLSEVALMVIFGAFILLGYSLLTSGAEQNYASNMLLTNLKNAFLFSLSFMVLSGFFVSVIIVSSLRKSQLSWKRRALFDSALLIIHTAIFVTVFGESYSVSDASLVILGIVVVVLSEAISDLPWRGRCSPHRRRVG